VPLPAAGRSDVPGQLTIESGTVQADQQPDTGRRYCPPRRWRPRSPAAAQSPGHHRCSHRSPGSVRNRCRPLILGHRVVFAQRGEHGRSVQAHHRHTGQLTASHPQPPKPSGRAASRRHQCRRNSGTAALSRDSCRSLASDRARHTVGVEGTGPISGARCASALENRQSPHRPRSAPGPGRPGAARGHITGWNPADASPLPARPQAAPLGKQPQRQPMA
jgi:hypothetical protein